MICSINYNIVIISEMICSINYNIVIINEMIYSINYNLVIISEMICSINNNIVIICDMTCSINLFTCIIHYALLSQKGTTFTAFVRLKRSVNDNKNLRWITENNDRRNYSIVKNAVRFTCYAIFDEIICARLLYINQTSDHLGMYPSMTYLHV